MSNCGFSLHWAGVFAWTASACTGPASSSDSASWTNRCRCKGLIPSKRELTTATRKCVSLPAGTAWPPLSLRSSSTSGLRACSNLARIAASTGPPAADPALPRDTHARVAMETMHRANRALSIRGTEMTQTAASPKPIPARTTAHKGWEPGAHSTAYRQLNRSENVFPKRLGWSKLFR